MDYNKPPKDFTDIFTLINNIVNIKRINHGYLNYKFVYLNFNPYLSGKCS